MCVCVRLVPSAVSRVPRPGLCEWRRGASNTVHPGRRRPEVGRWVRVAWAASARREHAKLAVKFRAPREA